MALIEPRVRRIYFDSNIFIYTIEKHTAYIHHLTRLFAEIEANGQLVVTSELSFAECLVGARKARSRELEQLYEALLTSRDTIHMEPIDRKILHAAALHAGDGAAKLADAIHVVTALEHDCEVFFTNDKRVRAPSPLTRLLLDDLKA